MGFKPSNGHGLAVTETSGVIQISLLIYPSEKEGRIRSHSRRPFRDSTTIMCRLMFDLAFAARADGPFSMQQICRKPFEPISLLMGLSDSQSVTPSDRFDTVIDLFTLGL